MASPVPKIKPLKALTGAEEEANQTKPGILADANPTLASQPAPDVALESPPAETGAPASPDYSQIPAPPESMGAEERTRYYAQFGVSPPPNSMQGSGILGSGLIGQGGSGTNFNEEIGSLTGGSDGQAWSPTAGIMDQVQGIETQNVDASTYDPAEVPAAQTATSTGYAAEGYTSQQAPEAQGFTAEGYTPETVNENLSDAVARITDQDGILMQRRGAQAQAAANARGLGNSTMALEAGQAAVIDAATQLGQGDIQVGMFNADAKNQAAQFLSNWKNTAAQFIAAEKNQNGRFNAEQANQAAAFTANAKNQAAAFAANAQNTASMFNAGEANRLAMFAVEQSNLASRFAAEAEAAAKMFNASEFNKASQRYADAMNAALAAQNDAENLARRDTAQIKAELLRTKMTLGTQQQMATTAAVGAAATAQANREVRMQEFEQQAAQFGLTLSAREREFFAQLSASQFNQFQSGLNAGMLTEMEPGQRQNWLRNYMSMWNANGGLNFDIDLDMFPPADEGTP